MFTKIAVTFLNRVGETTWYGWVTSRPQRMTEAEHNRLIPKLFSNRPSALAAEVFALLIGH